MAKEKKKSKNAHLQGPVIQVAITGSTKSGSRVAVGVATTDVGIVTWLGALASLKKAPRTSFDYIRLAEKGIPKRSLDELAANIGVTRKNLAENIFDISIKTLERKTPNTKLDKKISSHALEIEKVLQHATEVFHEKEKVKQWIHRENRALNGMKPVELFDTLTGLNLVNDILGRIEEGVYS